MVCAIIGYLHSGKQRLWRGKGASGPACWRQAGLGVPFLLGWLASEPALRQSEDINPRGPLSSAHDARPPPELADCPQLSGFWGALGGLPLLIHPFHRRVYTRTHAEYYPRKG